MYIILYKKPVSVYKHYYNTSIQGTKNTSISIRSKQIKPYGLALREGKRYR